MLIYILTKVKYIKHLNKHKEVGLSEMQNIVDVLENPNSYYRII